jgi:alanine racemase
MTHPDPGDDAASSQPANAAGPLFPRVGRVDRDLLHRPRLLVSDDRLRHNLATLRAASPDGIVAVVKADAYGHGAGGVVDALFQDDTSGPPVEALAVAAIDEALAVPSHDVPVMVLRPIELAYLGGMPGELEAAVRAGIWLSVVTPEAAGDVARVARRLGTRATVQVMLDTGMSREMAEPRQFVPTIEAIRREPALRLGGVGTHLTDGERDEEPYSDEQTRDLHAALELVRLPKQAIVHFANSGGVTTGHARTHGGPARCGLALYGIDPRGETHDDLPLRPAARLVSPLLSVREIPAGSSVGYGRTWHADTATRIGLLPLGYADGYDRHLSNQALVRLPAPADHAGGDAFCRVVGRVSMDYLTIDLASAPWASAGDQVIVIDDDPASPCSAQALADLCGTIPYELLCGIGHRVPRLHW